MRSWYMLTLVGEDKTGIVAKVTEALFTGGCNLGEASMIRLGGNFTVMLMVEFEGDAEMLLKLLQPVTSALSLHTHLDRIEGHLHEHREPDVRISVFGADRAGIVAQVTGVLADAGLDILDLDSDVAGTNQKPIYIMHIEGLATKGIESLEAALKPISDEGIGVAIEAVDTLIG